jgi:single-stranded-DNA-specific exonuclease
LDEDSSFAAKKSTVIYGDQWSKGVLGIVASRLVEQYYKPTVVFSQIEDQLTGSARSIKNFDIHTAIGQCGDLVEQFGGHMYAAGLTIKKENFNAFQERFETIAMKQLEKQELVPEVEYDIELPIDAITEKFVEILDRMEPFGPGNMMPVFRSNGFTRSTRARVLKEKHLKFTLMNEAGHYFDVIGFSLGDKMHIIESGKSFDICYSLEYNVFRGERKIQMKLKDIKFSNEE